MKSVEEVLGYKPEEHTIITVSFEDLKKLIEEYTDYTLTYDKEYFCVVAVDPKTGKELPDEELFKLFLNIFGCKVTGLIPDHWGSIHLIKE